jgi:hypothetical protein
MLSLSSSLFRLGLGFADHVSISSSSATQLSRLFLGCKLVQALACLAVALAAGGTALTEVQVVQLASSLAVVWHLGRSMLERGLKAARASSMVGFELDGDNILFKLAAHQSLAAYSMLVFLHAEGPPRAATSFARGFMKPGTVLPWLEVVAEAFELVPGSALEPGEPQRCPGLSHGPSASSATAAATKLDSVLTSQKNAAGFVSFMLKHKLHRHVASTFAVQRFFWSTRSSCAC